MTARRFARARGRDLWQRHPHTLLAHRPCPPVAHSITLVALFRSVWTSDASGSSGRSAATFTDLTEKMVPATLADSLAVCVVESHVMAPGWPIRNRLTLFGDFFLFNVMTTHVLADGRNLGLQYRRA
jgi:hypothetical protein